MSDNIKFINNLEKLLHEKEGDYGHFDHTAFVMGGMMEKYLSVHNNKPVSTFKVLWFIYDFFKMLENYAIKRLQKR